MKNYDKFFDDLTVEVNKAFDFTKHIEDSSNVTDKYLEALQNFNLDFGLAIDDHIDFTIGELQEMLEDKNSALYKDCSLLSELVFGLLDGSLKIVKE